jgi:hypothetical protein
MISKNYSAFVCFLRCAEFHVSVKTLKWSVNARFGVSTGEEIRIKVFQLQKMVAARSSETLAPHCNTTRCLLSLVSMFAYT